MIQDTVYRIQDTITKKMLKNLSLKIKILLILLLLTLLPLSLIILITSSNVGDSFEKEALEDMQALAHSKAISTEILINSYRENVAVISKLTTVMSYTTRIKTSKEKEIYDEFYRFKAVNPSIDEIAIVDLNGLTIVCTNRQFIGEDRSKTLAFVNQSRDVFVEQIFEKDARGTSVFLIFSTKIFNYSKDEYIGVLTVKVKGDILNRLMKVNLPGTTEAYIINKNNLMIAGSMFGSKVEEQLINTELVVKTFTEKTGARGIYDNYKSQKVLGATNYLPSTQWVAVVEQNVEESIPSSVSFMWVALVVIVCLIVAFLLWMLINKMIIEPIAEAEVVMRNLNLGGNLGGRLNYESENEIGRFTNEFNKSLENFKIIFKHFRSIASGFANSTGILKKGIEITSEGTVKRLEQLGSITSSINDIDRIIGSYTKSISEKTSDFEKMKNFAQNATASENLNEINGKQEEETIKLKNELESFSNNLHNQLVSLDKTLEFIQQKSREIPSKTTGGITEASPVPQDVNLSESPDSIAETLEDIELLKLNLEIATIRSEVESEIFNDFVSEINRLAHMVEQHISNVPNIYERLKEVPQSGMAAPESLTKISDKAKESRMDSNFKIDSFNDVINQTVSTFNTLVDSVKGYMEKISVIQTSLSNLSENQTKIFNIAKEKEKLMEQFIGMADVFKETILQVNETQDKIKQNIGRITNSVSRLAEIAKRDQEMSESSNRIADEIVEKATNLSETVKKFRAE
jgi:methyl-accepting chemotaxis protein